LSDLFDGAAAFGIEVAGGALLYLLLVVSAFLVLAIFWAWAALIRFAVREIRLKIAESMAVSRRSPSNTPLQPDNGCAGELISKDEDIPKWLRKTI
jgi:hypothetical protein